MALQERIELIKPTLFTLEEPETKDQGTPSLTSESKALARGRKASSASRVSSRDIQKLENQGTRLLTKYQEGKLPREEGEAYVIAIYAHLSRPCSSKATRVKLEDLRVFAETICPGFKPSVLNSPQPVSYGFQGELVKATGGINQFSFLEGSQASCASNALNFITESLAVL